ncbi:MAG: polysaccharide deacetylase family protein [Alphaproteobacteria bacterium]|nr:polysaccharide deacetylase family protein [Alphaproteobacteria bacterium]
MLDKKLLSIACVSAALLAVAPARADVITRIPTNDKVIALTFDACEAGERVSFDRGILDYLLLRKIPFTVFASGKFVRDNAEDIANLAKLDFVDIENHSWNHPNFMNRFSQAETIDQVQRTDAEIEAITGRKPQFFRFPAGNYSDVSLSAVESLGHKVVHWRWASGDPDPRESANALYNRVREKVVAGDILIFHINGRGHHTAEALPRIVEQLEAENYRFVLVSDYIGTPHPKTAPEPFTTSSLRQRFYDVLARAPLTAIPLAVD